jgi:hypothetical protein
MQQNGQHFWYTAPSGTAGNTISFTQAMTLTAGGNLGVNNINPGSPIDVTSNSSALGLRVRARTGDDFGFIQFTTNSGSTDWASVYAIPNTLVFSTAGSERARITSAGNLAIGKEVASESYTSGSGFGFAAPSNPFFSVVNLATSSNNACIYLNQRNTAGTNSLIVFLTNNGSSQSSVGSITHNGTNTTYGTSSDYRLKENVAPMTGALNTIAALKPVTYTWKADGSNGQGFIAHELQSVVPDAVTGEKDAVDKDGSIKPQNVDTSYLVATLVSAIQELTARLEVLENK